MAAVPSNPNNSPKSGHFWSYSLGITYVTIFSGLCPHSSLNISAGKDCLYTSTVALIERASRKTSICLQTLKVGANDRSAQELQNGV